MADYYSSASSLEIDSDSNEDHSDIDSAFGDCSSTKTGSVVSSVYKYRFQDGRRYHAYGDGQYYLPNDEEEQDRLDLQHHLFRLTTDGALNVAPLPENIRNVLDVGCGTGIWCIDFADEWPNTQVLGIDLSPIQPGEVPPNCSFRIDDVEQDWINHERFDYIHSRAMIGGIRDWPRFFANAFKHLRPGGYIELQDMCFPPRIDDPVAERNSQYCAWGRFCVEGAMKVNLNLQAPLKWVEQLREAGFVDIHMKWYSWPIGPWAKGQKHKLIGKWAFTDFYNGITTPVALFTRALGWLPEEFQVHAAQVRSELKEQKPHVYQPIAFCYARKPPNLSNMSHPTDGEAFLQKSSPRTSSPASPLEAASPKVDEKATCAPESSA